jgi:hypothetical protein
VRLWKAGPLPLLPTAHHRLDDDETTSSRWLPTPRPWTLLTPKGQWLLADAKYTKSWKERKNQVLDFEVEVGTMIGPSTGVLFRTGTSFLDGNREFVALVGLRKIW